MYAAGQSALPLPLESAVPWPNGAATLAPSGFAPGANAAGSAPLCPAGLPYFMAVAMWIGGPSAWFWVVPLFGALAAWSTYRLGAHVASSLTGAAAAWLLVCSPVFLYQVFQPMSDVPAAALWAAALAVATRGLSPVAQDSSPARPVAQDFSPAWAPAAAGLVAGLATMVRPNLAPLALVPLALVAWRGRRIEWLRAAAFVAGAVPGVAAVAIQQTVVYGSPLQSGYGSLAALFDASNVWPNARLYTGWLLSTHGPVFATALAAPLVVRPRRVAWLLLGFAGATVAAYLPYLRFDNWSFVRFLLPAFPVLIVLTAAVAGAAAARLSSRRLVPAAILGAVVATGGWWVAEARELSVFRVKSLERKYPALGAYVAVRLPQRVAVLAAQPAGAVRYYADRPTISWDAIEPDWLERVDAELRSRGLEPYLAIETFEMDAFRQRFGPHSPLGQLDWPPRATFGRTISLYRLDDRPRYLRGDRIPTERFTWPVE